MDGERKQSEAREWSKRYFLILMVSQIHTCVYFLDRTSLHHHLYFSAIQRNRIMFPVWLFGKWVKYVWWRKANIFHVKEQTLCLLDTPRYICEVSGGSHNPLIHIPFCCVSCTDSCIQHLYILYILLYYAKVLETYSKFNLAWNHFITLNFFAYFNHKPDCLLF